MGAQDKDESKLLRRDEALARRVGDALDRVEPRGAEDCPDAGLLAAYADGALGPDESAQWEGHFAACARCRKILRVLAASADAPLAGKEVAQLGQLVSAVRAPAEITGAPAQPARSKRIDWRTRWLAPAIGVAAVLVVWIAMRTPRRAVDQDGSGTLVAQAPKEAASPSPAPEEADRFSKATPLRDETMQAAPTNAPAKPLASRAADIGAAQDAVSPSKSESAGSLDAKKQLSAAVRESELKRPAAPASSPDAQAQPAAEAPAPAQPTAKAASNMAATETMPAKTNANDIGQTALSDKTAVGVLAETREASGGAAAQGASPELRLNGRKEKPFAVARSAQNLPSLLKSPSGAALWRAGDGGRIERSTDGGKTWASQISPSQEDWLTGAAISDTVCWLAGRNGAIARTVDGSRWQQIAPPQAARTDGKLPDWISITAGDAQSATITASDGRKFATADGGRTWRQQ